MPKDAAEKKSRLSLFMPALVVLIILGSIFLASLFFSPPETVVYSQF